LALINPIEQNIFQFLNKIETTEEDFLYQLNYNKLQAKHRQTILYMEKNFKEIIEKKEKRIYLFLKRKFISLYGISKNLESVKKLTYNLIDESLKEHKKRVEALKKQIVELEKNTIRSTYKAQKLRMIKHGYQIMTLIKNLVTPHKFKKDIQLNIKQIKNTPIQFLKKIKIFRLKTAKTVRCKNKSASSLGTSKGYVRKARRFLKLQVFREMVRKKKRHNFMYVKQ